MKGKLHGVIVALAAIAILICGCQEELQQPPQSPVTAKQIGQIVKWSRTVDSRLNAISKATDPNSLISQVNGQFARNNSNLLYLYSGALDPNDPNSLASRVEVLEENKILN